ncbi:MAG: fatty acid desaturase family protein [Bacteriovoracaceae bacterium]|nr:fatty acid desaturase family protein [Bacteriovoracaceae bacterium]
MEKTINPANPLTREQLKKFTTVNTAKGLSLILLDYAILAVLIIAAAKINHWAIYLLAIPFIANRQHSLLIQMHDAAHGNISKNKKLNDFVGELLTAWPMFIRMEPYRITHNLHHSFSNTNKDPDFIEERFPQSQELLRKHLLKDLFGLGILDQFKNMKKLKAPASPKIKALRIAFYLTLAGIITFFGVWKFYLLLWVLPLFTWLKFILHIRSIADHSGPGLQLQEHPFNTRTVKPSLFDILFIAPRNCSYHMAHSIYASVPTYHLKDCHNEIMKHSIFQEKARITDGYHNLLSEFPKTEKEVKEKDFDFFSGSVFS